MGFPTNYSPMVLPRLFISLAFVLGFVRRLLIAIFYSIGLSNFLHSGDQSPQPFFFPLSKLFSSRNLFLSSTLMISGTIWDTPAAETCAVCLRYVEGSEEVRRLRNCRHVFHRCCLDRWIELDQCSCPLCRSSLIPSYPDDAFFGPVLASTAITDSYSPSPEVGLRNKLYDEEYIREEEQLELTTDGRRGMELTSYGRRGKLVSEGQLELPNKRLHREKNGSGLADWAFDVAFRPTH